MFGGGGNGGNPHTKIEDNNCPRQTWIPTPHHSTTRNMHHRTYTQRSLFMLFTPKKILPISFSLTSGNLFLFIIRLTLEIFCVLSVIDYVDRKWLLVRT